VLPGKRDVPDRSGPVELHGARRPHVVEQTAAPRVPSKQVNANTLPATNLRASSAVIAPPASAGKIIAGGDGTQYETRKHAVTPT